MFTQKELLKMISKIPYDNGGFKVFIRLNNKLGIKICGHKRLRDNNYSHQESASLFGLGPEVYGKFDIEICNKTLYGYYTEVVEIFKDLENYSKEYSHNDLNKLGKDLLSTTGFRFDDSDYNNVGIKNGVLVCIDFDSTDDMVGGSNSIINLIKKLTEEKG